MAIEVSVTQIVINATVVESPLSAAVEISSAPILVAVSNIGEQAHDLVTIGSPANGLSLNGQILSIVPASAGVTGALSGADWSAFDAKQPAGAYLTSVVADSPLSGAGTAGSHLVIDLSGRQPLDTGLTSLAGLTYVSTSFVKMTGADTFTLDTATYEPADATIVKTGNASWIDLTDGGATTLHSHAGGGGSAPFTDSTAIIKGSADDTKLWRVEVDGFTTGQTRVFTPPDANLTITGGGTVALGGFTLTVPATGTAALLATANVFTAVQTVNLNAATAQVIIGDSSTIHMDFFKPSTVAAAYANAGGTGDRTSTITATTSLSLAGGTPSNWVNGDLTETVTWWDTQAVAGLYIRFYFTTYKQITEAKFYQSNSNGQGTWKWQGSNNGTTWTDIGSSFTLGGATTQTMTELSGNGSGYQYYQLLGVSGSTVNNAYAYEFEFKISEVGPAIIQGYSGGSTAKGPVSINPSGGDIYMGGKQISFPIDGVVVMPDYANTFTVAQIIDLSSSAIGLTIQGAATQTHDHLVIENSSGTDIFAVDKYGRITSTMTLPDGQGGANFTGNSYIININDALTNSDNNFGFDVAVTLNSDASTYGLTGSRFITTFAGNTSADRTIIGGQFRAQVESSSNVYMQAAVGGDFLAVSSGSRPSWISDAAYAGRFGIELDSNTAHTTALAAALYVPAPTKGANITITTLYGLKIDDVNVGATNYAIYTGAGLVRFGDVVNTTASYQVDGAQVVTNRVIDARIDDAINSGDATTDGVIDAIRDALISHGLIAAA